MTVALAKFAVFVAVVLGAPAALMAAGDPRLADLGKLVMIASPAVAGLLLNRGLGDRGVKPRWGWVGRAALITIAVAVGAIAAALAFGGARFGSAAGGAGAVVSHMAASGLTSVLEELGWAGGGLALAVAALGRRWGLPVLGLIWAAWHLVPTALHVRLFPELERAGPPMILAFVAACVIYRLLLTTLRERAGTWLAAAAGHAAPNILLAGLMSAGFGGFDRPAAWPFFPAPGGLVFPLLALGALALMTRMGVKSAYRPRDG